MDIYLRFARIRVRLAPYLSEELEAGIGSGVPLMRPLAFDWPEDPNVWRFPLHYMLGRDLLVAAVADESAETWNIYLPEGKWVDVWSCEPVAAGDVTVNVPFDRIPVFCKAASQGRLTHLLARSTVPA